MKVTRTTHARLLGYLKRLLCVCLGYVTSLIYTSSVEDLYEILGLAWMLVKARLFPFQRENATKPFRKKCNQSNNQSVRPSVPFVVSQSVSQSRKFGFIDWVDNVNWPP